MKRELFTSNSRTYKTHANAKKRADLVFAELMEIGEIESTFHYIIASNEDHRFYPVFLGLDAIYSVGVVHKYEVCTYAA